MSDVTALISALNIEASSLELPAHAQPAQAQPVAHEVSVELSERDEGQEGLVLSLCRHCPGCANLAAQAAVAKLKEQCVCCYYE